MINGFRLKHPFEEIATEEMLELPSENYDKDLELFTLAVASAQISLEECREWFRVNIVEDDRGNQSYAMAA